MSRIMRGLFLICLLFTLWFLLDLINSDKKIGEWMSSCDIRKVDTRTTSSVEERGEKQSSRLELSCVTHISGTKQTFFFFTAENYTLKDKLNCKIEQWRHWRITGGPGPSEAYDSYELIDNSCTRVN